MPAEGRTPMRRSFIETVMAAAVLIIAGLFFYFMYTTGYQKVEGYDVTAKFNSVAGLTPGSDVKMSGIKVGSVVGARLDPDSYLAILRLTIESSIKLPVDTVAKITSDSLSGRNYVSLKRGADNKIIPPNGQIKVTQDPVSIDDLVGRYIFGNASGPKQPGTKPDQGQQPKDGSSGSSGQ